MKTMNHPSPHICLHADLSQRCVVHSPSLDWVGSPSAGVARRMLERDGGEVARATSIVRYAPGSAFASHTHSGGEEILVLDGTLHDEHGTYGPGTYLKNPVGSSHAPASPEGCTLFVKLRHLDPRDDERVVIDTQRSAWRQGLVEGLKVLPLNTFETQNTALVRWAPQTFFNPHRHWGGEEIFVIEGVFSDEHGDYQLPAAGCAVRT